MKKLLLLSGLFAIALVGCKRNNVEAPQPQDNGEIKIGSPSLLVKAPAETHDAFVNGDQIGVYSIPNKDADLSGAKQSNVGYVYDQANTLWSVIGGQEALKWQFTGAAPSLTEFPVDLIAYFPYNATLALESDNKSVPYSLEVDQSTTAAVVKNDLLWARSTGQKTNKTYEELTPGWGSITGAGIKKSTDVSSKINLNFHHMMASVDYKVAVKATVVGSEKFSDVKLNKIEFVGPDVKVSGVFDLSKGAFTSTDNASGVSGSVKWADAAGVDLLIQSVATPTFDDITSMIVQPEDFTTKEGNFLKYTFSYKYDAAGDGFKTENVTKDFYYPLKDVKSSSNSTTAFSRNTKNILKALVMISSNEIRISTSIEPWSEIEHDEIQPE